MNTVVLNNKSPKPFLYQGKNSVPVAGRSKAVANKSKSKMHFNGLLSIKIIQLLK